MFALLLAVDLAVGSTEPDMSEEYLTAIRGATAGTAVCAARSTESPLGALLREIDSFEGTQAGEHAPSTYAINQARILIAGARTLVHHQPPVGDADFYYGELGVEWRTGNRILRLTSFSDSATPARLDYGTMSIATPGEYNSDQVASPERLAELLDWVSEENNHIAAVKITT